MTDVTVDPAEVMTALTDVSPELMWEFGPSPRGHALTITAEWNDANRALARAVINAAPELPRWEFFEVRRPEANPDLAADFFSQRFREPLTLTSIGAVVGRSGRVDLVGHGTGSEQALADQVLKVASLILGEAVERDWIGFIDGAPTAKAGLLKRLSGKSATAFDPAAFAEDFRAAIAKAKSELPEQPYAELSLDEREVSLFKAKGLHDAHPRADLLTFAVASKQYGHAALSRERFSSACHSIHGEWFLYVRILRTEHTPFDDVGDRGIIEENLHAALSKEALGGVVGAGHGRGAVYIDLAVTDVPRAIAQITQTLSGHTYTNTATIHFMDQVLQSLVLPAAQTSPKPN
ncbi:MAG: hypothetical protein ACSHW1_00685 [Yoonia sp.]|uniref:hypothetical protein n=1 Tax=Yoonia sp. TaxID=2212373 RepID=UPI003EF974B1